MLLDQDGNPIKKEGNEIEELEESFKEILNMNQNIIVETFIILSKLLFHGESQNTIQVTVSPADIPEGGNPEFGYYYACLSTMLDNDPSQIKILMQANTKIDPNE